MRNIWLGKVLRRSIHRLFGSQPLELFFKHEAEAKGVSSHYIGALANGDLQTRTILFRNPHASLSLQRGEADPMVRAYLVAAYPQSPTLR